MDLRGSVDCVYFLKGQCRNGVSCPFKHDSAKLPVGVLDSDGHAKNSEDCYYFLQGRCSKGSQCPFWHDQAKLKPNLFSEDALKNPSLSPVSATVAAPVLHAHGLAPSTVNTSAPSVQGHVSAPNGRTIDGKPSSAVLNKSMHGTLGIEARQRPCNIAGGIELSAAEPQPGRSSLNNIQSLQITQRKRKDQEDFCNINAGTSCSQPSKPVAQLKNVECPTAAEDVIFNAPKTIEEIRAQKKVKTESDIDKKKTANVESASAAKLKLKPTAPVGAVKDATDTREEMPPAVPSAQDPPGRSVTTIEVQDIDDVDGIDDDDFEAQMRALEAAL